MKNWIIGAVLVLAAAAAFYYFKVWQPAQNVIAPAAPPVVEETAPPPEIPAVQPGQDEWPEVNLQTAEPAELEEVPLPMLSDSDPVAREALGGLMSESDLTRFIVSENIIPRIVATVDLLGSRQIPGTVQAINGPESSFIALDNEQPATVIRNEEGDEIPQFYIDPSNYQRYTPYVELLEGIDTALLIESYRSHASLFQQAYRQMGYAEGEFSQRLAVIVDELLATPAAGERIELVKPEAYYLFTDPALESLSAGQKILLRMGNENAARVKAKLAEIRDAL
jgi:hypothetical protein